MSIDSILEYHHVINMFDKLNENLKNTLNKEVVNKVTDFSNQLNYFMIYKSKQLNE